VNSHFQHRILWDLGRVYRIPYTLNVNCDLILNHAGVNAGLDFGFLLQPDSRGNGPIVSVQRETDSDGLSTIKVFFSVRAADRMVDADGSAHEDTRSEMYAMLTAYLSQASGLQMRCGVGTFSGLSALGHVSTEQHFPDYSIVTCQLNNSGPYYPPADPALFYASIWDGTLTWNTSYWR
jgi:hypothetical protein